MRDAATWAARGKGLPSDLGCWITGRYERLFAALRSIRKLFTFDQLSAVAVTYHSCQYPASCSMEEVMENFAHATAT